MLNRRLRDSSGVTLLETLVAAIMSGILLAAALPSLSSSLGAHTLKAAVRTTTNYVRVVRSTAVARNTQARLSVAADGTQLKAEVLSGGTWTAVGGGVTLENGVRVSAVNPTTLVFTPQGTSANGASTLTVLTSRGDTHTVAVSLLGSVES